MEFTRVFAALIDTEQVNQTELARSLHVSKQAITYLKKRHQLPFFGIVVFHRQIL